MESNQISVLMSAEDLSATVVDQNSIVLLQVLSQTVCVIVCITKRVSQFVHLISRFQSTHVDCAIIQILTNGSILEYRPDLVSIDTSAFLQ